LKNGKKWNQMNNLLNEKEEIIWEGNPSQIKYLHVDIGIPPEYI